MATLVLSTVGTVLGGPIGGAIGGLLGQSIDQQVFGPGPRSGPRMGDLSVQTSNYGAPVPRLYGSMRVAGTIIWSTDLQEASQTSGAKGQPDTVTYSYSASFAVALSSRRIQDIGRIWADGKLIRTEAGEFTVDTVFRFHDGSENQPVDPLIATIEGLDRAPAYRGTALAVFEHLQLAEFGNRIPFLTFEVVADLSPVSASTVLNDVSSGAIMASQSPMSVTGYAAYGTTIAAAIGPLVEVLGLPLADDGGRLATPTAATIAAGSDDLGCSAGPEGADRMQRSQTPARDLPSALSLTYYDASREYQAGLARASLQDLSGGSTAIELPAVIAAATAKGLAETALARRWAERDRLTLRLPPEHLGLKPGAIVQAELDYQKWVAERVTVDSLVVVAELRPAYSAFDSAPADPGRAVPSLGVVPAPTTVALVELPDDGSGTSDAPVMAVAASSTSESWRPVPLDLQVGTKTASLVSPAARSVQGSAATALGMGQAALIDAVNSVEVVMVGDSDWLESVDDDALVNGANLALIGRELVQFGEAIALGAKRFRLSRLLRGRRGTEWAMGSHQIGEAFVFLDPRRLKRLNLGSADLGAPVRVAPRGLADKDAQPVELKVAGEAMRPPSPVHLRTALDPDGSLRCSWVRRSSKGWAWLDSVDAPLGCSAERYQVSMRGSAKEQTTETASSSLVITAAELGLLGGPEITISVVQVGDYAASRPTELTIPTV